MARIPNLRRVFRLDILSPRVEREVDDELRFHFDETVAALVAEGLTTERARAEAERRFGEVGRYREELERIDRGQSRRRRRATTWEAMVDDVRRAARGLRRRPGFSLSIVVMLALGIGANATMFGVIDRLLLRPPPHVAAPDQLRQLYLAVPVSPGRSSPIGGFAPGTMRDVETALAGYAEVAASAANPAPSGPGNMTLGSGANASPVRGVVVTGGYLPMLGVRPVLGRLLLPADDTVAGASPAAVLGYRLWRQRFGGARTVIGSPIQVDGAWYTVAGVLPPDFRGLELTTPDVWLPLGPVLAARRANPNGGGEALRLFFIVRLRPGISDAAIETRAAGAFAANTPGMGTRTTGADLRPIRSLADMYRDRSVDVSLLTAGVSTLLLLVACASVANMLLARGLERWREIAVQLALGISRGRLVRQLLVESLLLALAGGAAALGVVRWGGALLQPLLLAVTGSVDRPVDGRVLAFTAAVALATGLLAGLAPAVQASRPSLAGALRRGVQEGGGRRARTRTTLAAVQMALCVLLLVGTGLFVRSLRRLHAVPLGLAAEQVVGGTYHLDRTGYDQAAIDALYSRAAERVRDLPGVRSVAVSDMMPFQSLSWMPIHADGVSAGDDAPIPVVYHVTPTYFETLGIELRRGRLFGDADRVGAPPVMVVSEALARAYWPAQSPIGRCVHIGADTAPCTTVVGVVEDVVPMELTSRGKFPQFYVPIAQVTPRWANRALFALPAPGADPRAVAAAMRGAMQGTAPGLPFADVAPLAQGLDHELRPWRLGTSVFGAFGLLALVVAAVGLYGVLAFGVAQRRHEIGVRLALGADGGRVLRLVIGEALVVAGAGIGGGVVLALAGGPLVRGLLYQTAPTDPLVFAVVITMLLAVALVASFLPAWRASRVPPAEALRAE
jgi:predicted permease